MNKISDERLEVADALEEFAMIDEAEGGNPLVIATERRAAELLRTTADTEQDGKGVKVKGLEEVVRAFMPLAQVAFLWTKEQPPEAEVSQYRDAYHDVLRVLSTLSNAQDGEVTEAARDVLAERRRQKEVEGWTPKHDDTHSNGEMGKAAGVYALAASSHDYRWVLRGTPVNDYLAATFKMWPWDWGWFKPKDRRRDLVKAGALILAEIERLDRAALNKGGE